jgi:hypothetical protein
VEGGPWFTSKRRAASELEPRRFPHPDRCVQLLQPDGTAAHGLRQSGPRPVFSLGTLIIAAGPALCSPLKGVGCVTSKPQDLALAGLWNQKPTWNVFVGARSTSGSKPKIWSTKIENSEVVALPSASAVRSD